MRQTDRKAPNKINNQAFNRIEQRLNELDINFRKVTSTATATESDVAEVIANPSEVLGIVASINPTVNEVTVNESNGNVIVGLPTNVTVGGTLTTNSSITIKEKASETDTTAYGKVWVKDTTPNLLYFTDDTGSDFLLNQVPGTILTYISLNQASPASYALTTSFVNIDSTNAKVTFVSPRSGRVKIDIQLFIEEGNTSATAYLGLSDNAVYNALSANLEKRVNYGSRGKKIITHTWEVPVTPNVSETLWIGAKASGVFGTLYWGGTTSLDYPPLIITVTAL